MNFDGDAIHVIERDGNPWFVAGEVCGVLGLTNPTVSVQRLDDDEVAKLNLGSQSGIVNIINESGLYSLILTSRKPEAKTFKVLTLGDPEMARSCGVPPLLYFRGGDVQRGYTRTPPGRGRASIA